MPAILPVRIREQPAWWFQGRQLLEALAVRVHLHLGDTAAAERRFTDGLWLAEKTDVYGAAWLVAEVAGSLAEVGMQAASAQVGRFAALVKTLDYAPLTSRYEALLQSTVTEPDDAGLAVT
ncbi:MAG: hypothetical protein U0163_20145 [Gemmatimonadaceae bacterium]